MNYSFIDEIADVLDNSQRLDLEQLSVKYYKLQEWISSRLDDLYDKQKNDLTDKTQSNTSKP